MEDEESGDDQDPRGFDDEDSPSSESPEEEQSKGKVYPLALFRLDSRSFI